MNVSRVAFLKAFGTVLVGIGVDARALVDAAIVQGSPPATVEPSSLAIGRQRGRLRLDDATAALFLPHLHTEFVMRCPGGERAQMSLAEVFERPLTRNVEQFSLIFHMFHTIDGEAFPDGMFAIRHPTLGDFDLFMVPVGAPKGRCRVYQACFSRHLS